MSRFIPTPFLEVGMNASLNEHFCLFFIKVF